MFDLGWMELLIIGVTALIVVGPKDLPVMFKTVGNLVGKAKRMAREFKSTIEAAAEDTGLKESAEILKNIDYSKNPSNFFKDETSKILYGDDNDFEHQKLKQNSPISKKRSNNKKNKG